MTVLWRFVTLFALLYAAFGVSSPFMPAFFNSRGVLPQGVGALFAAGTVIRLISGPVAGRVADLTQRRRAVLAACTAFAALVAVGLLPSHGFAALLAVSVFHSAALAPTTTLADALALGSAERQTPERRFHYGWVRGSGSAIFIAGTLLSGQVVTAFGLGSIIVLHAVLLAGAAGAALLVPELVRQEDADAVPETPDGANAFTLLRMPPFRRLLLVSALVLGSHAMHDAFAVIRWSAAGISPAAVSVLWSESVAAEVLVFFLIGPALVTRMTPAGTLALAASAAVLRWVVVGSSTELTALALVQPLHGLTFAALHLACMRLIAVLAPLELAATAQALYALGAGGTTALLTLLSGGLYARLQGRGFLVMAVLAATAVPLTWRLRAVRRSSEAGPGAR
jgi:MFS transporter, PPP family, 3-phenylpropionic acid transporter